MGGPRLPVFTWLCVCVCVCFVLDLISSGGDTMKESFEQVGLAMFAYMTEIGKVEKVQKVTIEAEGN